MSSPPLQLKIVVVKLEWLVVQLEPRTVCVLPAALAQADADGRARGIRGDRPLLITLIDAVTSEAASHPLQLDALVADSGHLAHFQSLVAYAANDFVRGNV